MRTVLLAAAVILMATPASAAPLSDAEAFTKLKSLAGEWRGKAGEGEGVVQYRVGSGGTLVLETLFPQTPHEMLTLYSLQDGKLTGQHYCAMGNQPRFRYQGREDGALGFAFAGGSNLDAAKDSHVHEGVIMPAADGNSLSATWTVFKGGQKSGSNDFVLTRVVPLPAPATKPKPALAPIFAPPNDEAVY